jgi:glycosyltransferase involved in cell wall biosynthesis
MPQRADLFLISPCSGAVRSAAPAGVEAIAYTLAEGLREAFRVFLVATPDSDPPAGVSLVPGHHTALPALVGQLLIKYPAAIFCDHSGAAIVEGDHPSFFRVFHVEPRYVFVPTPSRRCGFVSEYLRGLFVAQHNAAFAACPLLQNGISAMTPAACVPLGNAVIYIGRLNRLKGISLATDACASLGVTLHLYGGFGREATEDIVFNDLSLLRELSARHPQAFVYYGPLSDPAEKWRALSSAQVVLIPSREPESCSLVALEAAAAGAPVAAFRHGGLVEYLSEYPGMHFAQFIDDETADIRALGEAIQRALESPRPAPQLPAAYTNVAMVTRYHAWLSSPL